MATRIRRATMADRESLFDIWLRSVQATHTFVSKPDLEFFKPLVRSYLCSPESLFWVAVDSGTVIGFMGISASGLESGSVAKMDSLFLAPEWFRCGAGRGLVKHAQALHEELMVDVNEQNEGACRFYTACGFETVGRSELDDSGRPYPLLHLRWRRNRGS